MLPTAAPTPTVARPRWGEQTRLAIANFPVSGEPMPAGVVTALAWIKADAAEVNAALGALDRPRADAVRAAAEEVAAGRWPDQFPVDVFQTGSGTSTNMNVNEVVAQRATELAGLPVHPNDHVNASQSSNDVFPSAVRIAAHVAVTASLVPALADLHDALHELAAAHRGTVKMARTHLMDAVPMTFGQEAAGWARGVQLGVERLGAVLPRLAELPLGGTAAGTGLNAPEGFGRLVTARLAERTGLRLVEAVDHVEAQSAQDVLVEASGALKVVALTLHRIAGDLRLLNSGPTGGLAEVRLAELQAGSSIMPGKVNPVICEVVQQVAAQVVGNDAAVTFAATASTLQLNTAMPVTARNVLASLALLTSAATLLAGRCVRTMTVDTARMRRYAERSPALVTALTPRIGYDRAAQAVHETVATGDELASVLRRLGIDAGDLPDLLALTRPGRAG